MDYSRRSRRDQTETEASHARSKSADYLMDSKMREESAPPENELQKFGEKTPNVSEHEMRFRKSTEKLHVPDWYREKKVTKETNLDASFDRSEPRSTTTYQTKTSDVHTYSSSSSYAPRVERTDRYESSEPAMQTLTTDLIPYGMFDKYKNEIEEMRRSRFHS
ncbi:unnamed protein product [Anisakis simplex]|uniref:Microtubule-associated protein futsch n=1 Tax=Anisakis simplex TaxID=6269 RepID=A0A0M3KJ31_ANISI|nr:unnamed protein product [Anisakis simplex]